MEDEKIKALFSSFDPELSSSMRFMERLEKNMEAVEIVKQHSAAMRRRNKIAVVIAAMTGFVAGILLTLLFPLAGDWISTFKISLPQLNIATVIIDYRIIAWIMLAALCGIVSYNTYEIAIYRLTPQEERSIC